MLWDLEAEQPLFPELIFLVYAIQLAILIPNLNPFGFSYLRVKPRLRHRAFFTDLERI